MNEIGYSQFRKLAAEGNVVPVCRTLLADLLTPVSVFSRLSQRNASRHCFLLESVEGGEHIGRYTFSGVNPFQIISCRGKQITVSAAGTHREENGSIFDFLREQGRLYRPVRVPGLPPFSGGAVGYLAYEAVRTLEKLPPRVAPDVDLDDARFMYFADLVAFDHVQHRLFLIANVLTEDGPASLREKYNRALKRLDSMERALRSRPALTAARLPRGPLRIGSNMTRGAYERIVKCAKEYIRAGDVFQVVLSQRLTAPVRVPPFQIYRALRAVNPSPYMYYLGLGDSIVLGSSPEMLLKVTGRELEYRPIAGTRPRGATEEEDLKLEVELQHDEKERAEHIMLVDLGRNDLGRVAEFNTVRPKRLMFVERYSHVMHLVSSIQGRLREEADAYSALAACFPTGTLTGAPKVRAMEIIDELEPTRRGIYGGAILYLDFSGNLESCIVIRTMVVKDGRAYVQAGAGIVADSVPSLEYQESMNKAHALMKAISMAESGL